MCDECAVRYGADSEEGSAALRGGEVAGGSTAADAGAGEGFSPDGFGAVWVFDPETQGFGCRRGWRSGEGECYGWGWTAIELDPAVAFAAKVRRRR